MAEIAYYSQEGMEQCCRRLMEMIAQNERGRLNAMVAPQYTDCSWENRSLTLRFHSAEWMSNPAGNTHGGAIASAMDITMGCLCWYMAGNNTMTPTVEMSVSYLRCIPINSDFCVRATVTHAGRKLLRLVAEGRLCNEPEKLCFTGSSTYYVCRESE